MLPGTNRIRGGWYGFCGHYFTTGSCPSPYTLPRVDARGFPVRPADGRPIDNLGRPVDSLGRPVDRAGALLLAPDGTPLSRAPRTRMCEDQVPERFGIDAVTQAPGTAAAGADPQAHRLLLHQPHAHQRRRGPARLLPPRPARLLRHVLRHRGVLLMLAEIGIAAAALIAGVSGAWSP